MVKARSKYMSQGLKRAIAHEIDILIGDWIKDSKLSKYSMKWFLAARDEAFKSDFKTVRGAYRIGCVLVYKNHIIGAGHNQLKTNPNQMKYNKKYRKWTNDLEFDKTCGHTLHAEIDALSNIPYPVAHKINWKKVKAYVFRVAVNEETGYTGIALPCSACAAAFSDLGIKKVYYTTGHLDNPFGKCDL